MTTALARGSRSTIPVQYCTVKVLHDLLVMYGVRCTCTVYGVQYGVLYRTKYSTQGASGKLVLNLCRFYAHLAAPSTYTVQH
jgi:hypothetical protein